MARGGQKPITTEAELLGLLLSQRGIEQAGIDTFFDSIYERDIHDPSMLSDMEIAVDRLYYAIKKGERIIVYGDYDVDGISSTAILTSTLRDLGAEVTPYIPHRSDEGYGLNRSVLEKLASEVDLVVTVDCGISNASETAWLKEKGVDTIITDHHTIPDQLPPALAIVHPQHPKYEYPCPWLSGAGVAWKLSSALLRDARSQYANDSDKEKWLLDLVALGTVADIVPMLGENRTIVRFGLEVLRRTRRPGLSALLDSLSLSRGKLSEKDIGFRIAPRLNAAGRMDHAQPALELVLTDSEERAASLIQNLDRLNQQRQTVTRKIITEAEQQIGTNTSGCIVVFNPEWPVGVVGLAANRLAEAYNVPAVVIGRSGTHWVGSGRCPDSVNILDVLSLGKDYLEKVGGHAHAAGFTVMDKKIEDFKSALSAFNDKKESALKPEYADAVVAHGLVSRSAARSLTRFAPYGPGNERPRFVLQGVPLADWREVGKQKEHAKFSFLIEDDFLDGIGFGLAKKMTKDMLREKVDVLGEIEEDEFRGRWRLQLSVNDIAPSGSVSIQEKK